MDKQNFVLISGEEWRIRVGEVFDIETARACLRHCRDHTGEKPARLVFDLSQTHTVYTAGIGAMLHVKSYYHVQDGNASILYQRSEVGELLRLVRLDRAFQLFDQGPPPPEHSQPSGQER